MDGRRAVAARAVEEFTQEVTEAEHQLETLKAEAVNMERAFRKVCLCVHECFVMHLCVVWLCVCVFVCCVVRRDSWKL